MGRMALIYGKSGSGKSRSLKNFAEDEILFLILIYLAQQSSLTPILTPILL